ncbi:hypothetical protein NDU88_005481 [Pleurodeles waltl]|uniref:Uncharacterized protein n=1 Tax=Pleurodeles waltl TaxID=8319 RepID=A0AAV7SM00_PLEWA|nr:hypothetical protein NDU88_005481 [Pleurodeles waltl]
MIKPGSSQAAPAAATLGELSGAGLVGGGREHNTCSSAAVRNYAQLLAELIILKLQPRRGRFKQCLCLTSRAETSYKAAAVSAELPPLRGLIEEVSEAGGLSAALMRRTSGCPGLRSTTAAFCF